MASCTHGNKITRSIWASSPSMMGFPIARIQTMWASTNHAQKWTVMIADTHRTLTSTSGSFVQRSSGLLRDSHLFTSSFTGIPSSGPCSSRPSPMDGFGSLRDTRDLSTLQQLATKGRLVSLSPEDVSRPCPLSRELPGVSASRCGPKLRGN